MSPTSPDQVTMVLRLTIAAAGCNAGVVVDSMGVRAAIGIDPASFTGRDLSALRSGAVHTTVGSLGTRAFTAAAYSDDGVIAIFHPDPWHVADPAVRANVIAGCDLLKTLAGPLLQRACVKDFCSALDELHDPVMMTDPEFRIVFWNQAAERVYGYEREEAVGRDSCEVIRAADPAARALSRKQIREQGRSSGHFTALDRSGEPVEVEVVSVALSDDRGKAGAVLTIMHDVREHWRALGDLRDSEERLRTAQEAGGIGIWEWDIQRGELYCSAQTMRIYDCAGTTVPTLEGWVEMIHPEDRDRVTSELFGAVAGACRFESEYRIMTRSGTRWLLAKARVTVDGNSEPVRMLGITLDVTDRKLAEQARSLSERRFEKTFNNAGIGMALMSKDGHFLRANRAYCDLTGYAEEQLRDMTFLDVTHPDDVAKSVELKQQLFACPESIYSIEKRYLRNDGRIVWARTSISLVAGDSDTESTVIAICEDVTDRRTAEQLVRESEQRYRMVVEGATEIIYQTDLSGCITFCNRAAIDFLGLEDDSLAGAHYLDFISPRWRHKVRRFYALQLARRTLSTYLELPLISRRGGEPWIGQNVQLVCDGDDVLGFQVIARDITDRIGLDQKVKESEMRFRSLIEYSSDIITIISADGTVKYVSPSMERVFGYTPEERLGRSTFDLVHPDDVGRVKKVLNETIGLAGAARSVELRLRDKQGRWRTVEVTGRNLLSVPAVNGIVLNSRDVTDSRAAQTALEDYAGQLKAKNSELAAAVAEAKGATQMKSRFLANMSHEIRTPMNGVLGMTELLLGTSLTADQRGFAETIRVSAESLLTIINDILDFSKIESGKLRLERTPFNVRELASEIQGMFEIRAKMKGIMLDCSVAPEVPDDLVGDRVRLGQVLTNLLGNAVKFTHHGSVRLKLSIVDSSGDGCTLYGEVTDTGIGILPEHRDQLFQSFVQGDASMTRRYGGTGLGLAISRELVSLMGGTIGFTSESGAGSTFWFTAILGRKTSVFTGTGSAEPDLESRASSRILLADDNAVNRRIAAAMLSQLGHVVDTVQNGQAALEALQNAGYDLVFMDVQMPELDGFEATRAIRRLPGPTAKVPIIAMTAHAMVGDRERCIEAGMDDYVSKPIKRESLEKVVSLWIQRCDLQRLAAATGATSALEGSISSHPGRGS